MTELQPEKIPLILIVDDDRTMRSLLNLAMEEEGYRAVEAENGEQCLSEYEHFQPDLMLLDAVMPDIDGFTCCQKIRSLPDGDRIPILMITVLDDPESVEQAFKAGATDYITKPIHWSVLSQRVRRLLDSNRVWSELAVVQAWEKLISQILEQLVSGDGKNSVIKPILASIQEWLPASGVLLYEFASQNYWESVAIGYPSIKDFSNTDFNFIREYGEQYQQGKPIVIEDIAQSDLPSAVVQQLQQLNTKSLSIVSLRKDDLLIGLLIMHFSSIFPQERLSPARLLDLANLLTITIS